MRCVVTVVAQIPFCKLLQSLLEHLFVACLWLSLSCRDVVGIGEGDITMTRHYSQFLFGISGWDTSQECQPRYAIVSGVLVYQRKKYRATHDLSSSLHYLCFLSTTSRDATHPVLTMSSMYVNSWAKSLLLAPWYMCWWAKTKFYFHMNVMKATFNVPCKVGESWKIVLALLLNHILNFQSSHLRMIVIHNFKIVICKERSLNPVTRIWCKNTAFLILAFLILNHKLSEFMKLTEIVIV
jgi:hypothetical protein